MNRRNPKRYTPEELRDLLRATGLMQQDMAAQMGVSQSEISRFMRGGRPPHRMLRYMGLKEALYYEEVEK